MPGNQNTFRRSVMAELDEVYERTDGSTPDHMIVSEAVWTNMKRNSKLERLRESDFSGHNYGYMGMVVWRSSTLDDRDKDALLLSSDVFERLLRQ